MTNQQLLLPLLLLTIVTQCMEQALVCKPKTIQDIQNYRDDIYKERRNNHAIHASPLDDIFFQENWSNNLNILEIAQQKNPRSLIPTDPNFGLIQNDDWYKFFSFNNYSFLGLATIAIKSKRGLNDRLFEDGDRKKKLLNRENPIQVPFKQKKEHIQKLLFFGFEPTPQDKELALLATYEEYGPSIIKKYLLLQYSLFLAEINIPKDIINYISLLMFEEESLI